MTAPGAPGHSLVPCQPPPARSMMHPMDARNRAFDINNVGFLREGRWILKDVSFAVPRGTVAAILGPNGSGKSTLARILSGYLFPSAGTVDVLGQRFGKTDLTVLRRSIALVQPAGPYEVDGALSAREVVLTGLEGTLVLYRQVDRSEREQALRILDLVGLGQVADHPYRTLSSGERLRSLIARALIKRPGLLILDEPTAGLDLLAREQVLATVDALMRDQHDRATTTLMITHHVEELPPSTASILLLDQGRVAASGTPEQVLREATLSRVYGCPVHVHQAHGRWSLHVDPQAWKQLLAHPARQD